MHNLATSIAELAIFYLAIALFICVYLRTGKNTRPRRPVRVIYIDQAPSGRRMP